MTIANTSCSRYEVLRVLFSCCFGEFHLFARNLSDVNNSFQRELNPSSGMPTRYSFTTRPTARWFFVLFCLIDFVSFFFCVAASRAEVYSFSQHSPSGFETR